MLFRNKKTRVKPFFGSENASQNAPSTLFFIICLKRSDCDGTCDSCAGFSLLMRSHLVTGHPKRVFFFWFENSALGFGKHKTQKLDLYLAFPPQIEISLKYNLTQNFPKCTLNPPTISCHTGMPVHQNVLLVFFFGPRYRINIVLLCHYHIRSFRVQTVAGDRLCTKVRLVENGLVLIYRALIRCNLQFEGCAQNTFDTCARQAGNTDLKACQWMIER